MHKLYFNCNYGILPKNVMKDRNLSIGARAVFAYLCAYAGNEDHSFPGRDLMTYELNISKDTLTKYMKELKDSNYVVVKQNKNNGGQFSNNIYYINPEQKEIEPCPKFSDTKPSDTKSSDTKSSDTKNLDITNNNITSNNITSNNITSNSSTTTTELVNYFWKNRINLDADSINLLLDQIKIHGTDTIMKAVDKGTKNGTKQVNYKYIEKILNDWSVNGAPEDKEEKRKKVLDF